MAHSQHQQRESAAPAAPAPVSHAMIKDTALPVLSLDATATLKSYVPSCGNAVSPEPFQGVGTDVVVPPVRTNDYPELLADVANRGGDDDLATADLPDEEPSVPVTMAVPVTTAVGNNSPEVMARNREHAAASRKRKIQELGDLEDQVKECTSKIKDRKKERQRLHEELREELGALLAQCSFLVSLGLM
ncbi:hypothetical protein GGF31_005352 [Allomyces arbusculus]|nr:hypothetical protein GGF31_005352 [Allomyces arbusculus]